jgi:hypothetical protein
MSEATIERLIALTFKYSQRAFLLSDVERDAALLELQAGKDFATKLQHKLADLLVKDLSISLSQMEEVQETYRTADLLSGGTIERATHVLRSFFRLNKPELKPVSDEMVRGILETTDLSMSDRLKASEVDPVAYDVLCIFIATSLQNDAAPPEHYRQFAAEVLLGERKRPEATKGPKRYKNAGRDRIVVRAIELGQKLGLVATRNDVSEPTSCCDLVAECLLEQGLSPTTYAGVKRIWLARGDKLAPFHRTMHGD